MDLPLIWTGPEDESSDSEVSDEASSSDGLVRPPRRCQEWDAVSEPERDAARRKLLIACAVSLMFMTGEVIGGYAAHSLAIMTDAAHLLTDFGSIAISLASLWISARPRTPTMTFGWHRAEILGMMLSVGSIWALTAVLVVSAAQRIAGGDYEIDSRIMLLTSGVGVGVNILMVLILHQAGSSHGHAHGPPPAARRRSHGHGNASVKAALVHVVGDLLQSVGVLLAATIIHFRPEYKIADPICTFLFSVLVLWTTSTITKDVFRVLMQAAPQDVSADTVRELLLSVKGVADVHNLHVWSLNMNHCLLSVHVEAEEAADSQTVLGEASRLLRSEFGFYGVTIQVERRRTPADATHAPRSLRADD